MEAWRIVVLCAMIAVFLIMTAAVIWYCCLVLSRRGGGWLWVFNRRWRYGASREGSADEFYFYDLSSQRQLRVMRLSDYEGKPLMTGGWLHGMGDTTAVPMPGSNTSLPPPNQRSGTAAPAQQGGTEGGSPTVFNATSMGISGATAAANVSQGPRYNLYRADHFRMALAHFTGDFDHTTLAISRQDPGSVLVEIDLDDFVSPLKRDAHMISSASSPCVLTRHFPFHRTRSKQTNGGGGGMMGSQQGTPMGGGGGYAPSNISGISAATNQQCREFIPPPLILPISPNITTNTPITLSNAYYLFMDDATSSLVHTSAIVGGGGVGGPRYLQGGDRDEERLVPTAIAERLEQLIAVDKVSGVYTVAPHATATINTKTQSAVIRYQNGNVPPRKVQRFISPHSLLTYSYEGPTQSLPFDPSSPPYLPAGRWSVCAKVTAATGTDFRTQSRVYTVEHARY